MNTDEGGSPKKRIFSVNLSLDRVPALVRRCLEVDAVDEQKQASEPATPTSQVFVGTLMQTHQSQLKMIRTWICISNI